MKLYDHLLHILAGIAGLTTREPAATHSATTSSNIRTGNSSPSSSSAHPSTHASATSSGMPQAPPLKVILMTGQSNMVGHGYIDRTNDDGNFKNGTLEKMVQDEPGTYGFLKDPETQEWAEFQNVWIAYNRQIADRHDPVINKFGNLTTGYGGDRGGDDQMGPELGFGVTLSKLLNRNIHGDVHSDNLDRSHNAHDEIGDGDSTQQVLLVKVAWGGLSLAVDFRPPSSGGTVGVFYNAFVAAVNNALSNLDDFFPDYSTTIGSYELAGLAWHQGWNDGGNDDMANEYEFNLANFIRDLRKDFDAPRMKVVVAVSGLSGYAGQPPRRRAVINAQFAVSDADKYPEFAGNVASVETRGFKREPDPLSPGNQGYHWNNNCMTYWLIGESMARAMVALLPNTKKETE